MKNSVIVKIPLNLYNDVCSVCNDPEQFCLDAVKKFIDGFPDD